MRLYDMFSKNKEYAKAMPRVSARIHSGITDDLDKALFGLFEGTILIITSLDRTTRTALTLDIALNNAAVYGTPTALFSSVMTSDKMAKQLWLSLCPSEVISKNTPLYLEEIGKLTISKLKERIIKLKDASLIELVIIDSIDCIYRSEKDENDKFDKLYEFVQEMKLFAKEKEIAIILTTSVLNEDIHPKEYAIIAPLAQFIVSLPMIEPGEDKDKRRITVNKSGDKTDLLVRFDRQRSTFRYMYPEWLEAKWKKLGKRRHLRHK